MTLEEARNLIFEDGDAWRGNYVDTETVRGEIIIDGTFTLDQVEALAVIAQEKKRQEAQAVIE